MKSREPVLVRGRDEWDKIAFPESVFRDRIEKIRVLLDEEKLDAILVYGRGDRDGNLCYVSNLVNKVPNWGLLVAITDNTVAVRNERSSRTRPVLKRGTWIEDLRFCSNVVEDVDEVVDVDVNDSNTAIGTVGFGSLPYRQRETFADEVADATVVECDDAFLTFREEKTRRERDQIARASGIIAGVHDTLLKTDFDALTEKKLATKADRIARLRGVQDVRVLVANPNGPDRHLRPPEQWSIDPSEPVTVYLAARYEGYWAEGIWTVRLDGESTDDPAIEEAERLYDRFLESIRPSVDVAELITDQFNVIDESDLAFADEYDLGHGIGLDVEERPVLKRDTPSELSEGTTLSVRLALETDLKTVFVTGDTIAVGADGINVLTKSE